MAKVGDKNTGVCKMRISERSDRGVKSGGEPTPFTFHDAKNDNNPPIITIIIIIKLIITMTHQPNREAFRGHKYARCHTSWRYHVDSYRKRRLFSKAA